MLQGDDTAPASPAQTEGQPIEQQSDEEVEFNSLSGSAQERVRELVRRAREAACQRRSDPAAARRRRVPRDRLLFRAARQLARSARHPAVRRRRRVTAIRARGRPVAVRIRREEEGRLFAAVHGVQLERGGGRRRGGACGRAAWSARGRRGRGAQRGADRGRVRARRPSRDGRGRGGRAGAGGATRPGCDCCGGR